MAKRDIYQEVTDKIIALLDKGTAPWHMPWVRGVGGGLPANMSTGKEYRGINLFLLAIEQMERGLGSNLWLTFKQAKAMGGSVRKGEKGTMVVFWTMFNTEDKATGEPIEIPMLRHYTVFNAEQCDGLEVPGEPEGQIEFEPLAEAEKIVSGYADGPEIGHGGSKAFYRPSTDAIQMPEPERFESREAYYSTLFHEMSHSTGHKSRLDRKMDRIAAFGSPEYSKEELVAEFSASMLCGIAGISQPTIEQSAAYIDGWRKAIKGDKRMIVAAAGAAQKAADWIIGNRPD